MGKRLLMGNRSQHRKNLLLLFFHFVIFSYNLIINLLPLLLANSFVHFLYSTIHSSYLCLNFYFFRKLYDIRSTAIHGGDWLKHSKKVRNTLNDKGWKFSSINEMFGMIERIIRIIIEKLLAFNINAVQFRENVNKDPLFFIKIAKFIIKT